MKSLQNVKFSQNNRRGIEGEIPTTLIYGGIELLICHNCKKRNATPGQSMVNNRASKLCCQPAKKKKKVLQALQLYYSLIISIFLSYALFFSALEIFVHRPVTQRIPRIFFISSALRNRQLSYPYCSCCYKITTQCPSFPQANKKKVYGQIIERRIVMQIPSQPQHSAQTEHISKRQMDYWQPTKHIASLVTH